jgi:CRISPR system Cascade subunit CasC
VRISSQCLKRSIRRSPIFREELEASGLAVRTRRLPQQVKERLLARGVSEELAQAASLKASGFGTKEGKEQQELQTAQTMFLSPADIEAVTDVLAEAMKGAKSVKDVEKLSAKDLQAAAELKGWRPLTPDLALFGRMITSDAFQDVEGSLQVAHALSTNKMDHEFDYYTAVDDLQQLGEGDEKGADMIGDVEFSSACFYKYFSLDFDALVNNLAGPAAEDETRRSAAREAARVAVTALLRAAVFTTPSGKQNSFAAHQLPDAILVECRPTKTPVSYANAFVSPARAKGDIDLVDDSLLKFADHVEKLTDKFSLKASPRLWFCTRDVPLADTALCETLDDLLQGLQGVLAAED